MNIDEQSMKIDEKSTKNHCVENMFVLLAAPSDGEVHLLGDTTVQVSSSHNPGNVGELVFEATNDTTLKVKVKGSDGVVRSATLTLS